MTLLLLPRDHTRAPVPGKPMSKIACTGAVVIVKAFIRLIRSFDQVRPIRTLPYPGAFQTEVGNLPDTLEYATPEPDLWVMLLVP